MNLSFVSLVAGRGKRLRPITDYICKPMYPILDKPFLAYTLENLRSFTDEVILVIGYKKEQVQAFFGTNWKNLKVSYVEQPILSGTAHALYQARTQLRVQDFLCWLGDTYLDGNQIEKLVESNHSNILCVKKVDFIPTSPVEFDANGRVTKAWGGKSHYADVGCWKFESSIWNYFGNLKGKKGELRFLEAVQRFMDDGHDVYVHEVKHWIHLGYTKGLGLNISAKDNRESLKKVVEYLSQN